LRGRDAPAVWTQALLAPQTVGGQRARRAPRASQARGWSNGHVPDYVLSGQDLLKAHEGLPVPAEKRSTTQRTVRQHRIRRSRDRIDLWSPLARLAAQGADRAVAVVRPADLSLAVAAVAVIFLLKLLLSATPVVNQMMVGPESVTLPGADRRAVLYSHLEPKNEYDVIGEKAPAPAIQFQRLKVREYTLQPGDTLSGMAARFGLSMDTLVSFNQIQDVRRMQVGDVYRIPNRDGLLYSVHRGDSLSSIAAAYSTSVNAILDANDLVTSTIQVGQTLFVPGARMNPTELKLILGELFVYPVSGRYTSGFGMRNDPFTGIRRFHNGIDLANHVGTPVHAAMPGVVAHIETQFGNYGKFIIIKHKGGFQTLYGHLSAFKVHTGQYVSQGDVIGEMGNTGRSTGPHLHFSIIKDGTFVDPLHYLH